MKVGDYEVEVSSLDKVLFPESGLTKGALIEYYEKIAPVMLPYLKDRPISMQRFPRGIDEKGFYQKEAPDYFPKWIDRVEIAVLEENKTQPQVVVNHAAALVYLANQGSITPHAWLSRTDRLDHPDQMIFDLDPPGGDFELVRWAAGVMRPVVEELGLTPFLKTTGSRGLHLLVPLDRSAGFDAVREFARQLVELLARRYPDRLTTEMRKDDREARLFLDYLRNAYAQTAVTPYAVRAKPGAPVAVPLEWEELDDKELSSSRYTIQNIFRRLGQKGDPWEGMMAAAQPLAPARQRLDAMLAGE